MADLLEGRRGIVVGVSGEESIGFQCARRMAELGARVVLTSRPARAASVGEWAHRAGAVDGVALDVDDEAGTRAGIENAATLLGGIDFIVHSVVHVPEGLLGKRFTEIAEEDFTRVLVTGAYSLVRVARHAEGRLGASSAPRIVAIGSDLDRLIAPSYHVAGVAKAALRACALYLAAELGPRAILVNVVSPGLIATAGAVRAIGGPAASATRGVMARKASTRRAVEYEDVADAVAFFASDRCKNVTGESLTVDGGFSKVYV